MQALSSGGHCSGLRYELQVLPDKKQETARRASLRRGAAASGEWPATLACRHGANDEAGVQSSERVLPTSTISDESS